jgi:hypothetical protein
VARDWTLSFHDERGDITEVTISEEQARRFMAGQAVAYWSSVPEKIGVDPPVRARRRGRAHVRRFRRDIRRRGDETPGRQRRLAGERCAGRQHGSLDAGGPGVLRGRHAVAPPSAADREASSRAARTL